MKVLDHGYVNVVDAWGSDEGIIEAARMSTQKEFQGWDKDERLLRYLWEHKHSTPFEFCGATFEIQAPIFVVREWHRHRTQSYSEASARYAPLPDLNYVPSVERLMQNSSANKQAATVSGVPATREIAHQFQAALSREYQDCQDLYRQALEYGVPKELARLCLPVGRYTRMRATANLRNWLAFLTLRLDPNAQWEIRQYANAVYSHLRVVFPRTIALFTEGLPEGWVS